MYRRERKEPNVEPSGTPHKTALTLTSVFEK